MRILLGLTGSVASILHVKLVEALRSIGTVDVILTKSSNAFIHERSLSDSLIDGRLYTDEHEWKWRNPEFDCEGHTHYSPKWRKNDRVLHIDLRDKASALVIAPCSANTLGKITNGICDNLLTSVARAWDVNRPIILAPAMNTHMWNHPLTKKQLDEFVSFSRNNRVIYPQSKMLACNTEGTGALAEISDIVKHTQDALRWEFPLHDPYDTKPKANGIPEKGHQGAFLTKRKHHTHTGVDLYTEDGQAIHAVEDGVIVGVEDFTGKTQQSPWWEETKCLLVEGASGVVCYGEMTPAYEMTVGRRVIRNQYIGRVKRVLPEHKKRPDIDGHSTSMLHVEIYKHGIHTGFEENPALGKLSDWNDLIDPTPFLLNSKNRTYTILKA